MVGAWHYTGARSPMQELAAGHVAGGTYSRATKEASGGLLSECNERGTVEMGDVEAHASWPGQRIVVWRLPFELTAEGIRSPARDGVGPRSTSDRQQLRRHPLRALYKPGSLKAPLGTAGATSMRRFAEEKASSSRSAASSCSDGRFTPAGTSRALSARAG